MSSSPSWREWASHPAVKTGRNRPYVPGPTRPHSANVPEGLLRQNADYQNQNARATASKRDFCLIIGQFFPQSEHRVDFHSENRHFGARLPAKAAQRQATLAATAPMYRGRRARATVYSSTFTPK